MSGSVFDLDAFLSGLDNDNETEVCEMTKAKKDSDTEDDDDWGDVVSKMDYTDNEEHLSDVGRDSVCFPKEPMFPEELCYSLRNQVEELTEENARLSRQLEEWRVRAKGLGPATSESNPLQGLGRSSELAANKIVELSKKIRELNAELTVAHVRASTAEAKLRKRQPDHEPALKKVEEKDNGDEVKELTEKLNSSNIKLCEARNQVQQLKHELKISHKALTSELGDGVPLQTALSPGWRGRAQQIITLQQKVGELNEKLSQTNVTVQERANLSAQIAQRQAEKERQAEHQKEVEGLKCELEDCRKKLDASKARIRVITSEMAALKAKLSTLQGKSDHDDQLIAALTGQLNSAAEKYRDREQHVASKLEEQLSALKKELSLEKIKSTQLHNIVAEKDSTISRLEGKLSNSNPVHPEITVSERPFSFDKSSNISSTPYQEVISSVTEAERLRLMELLSVTNRRLDDERLTLDRTQEQLRQERHKCARLETKLARLELERVGCSRSSSGYRKQHQSQNQQQQKQQLRPPQHHSRSLSQSVSLSEWETLKDKAELLEEKCLALETRLNCLRQEKEEDCRRYMNLIEETRHSFFDHIKKSGLS